MTAIILHRVDPAKNMHRISGLDVQRDLFGQWCLVREWATAAEAHAALVCQHASRSGAGIACDRRFVCRLKGNIPAIPVHLCPSRTLIQLHSSFAGGNAGQVGMDDV
jgi:hypothetical protein